jgi:hypothetical protein
MEIQQLQENVREHSNKLAPGRPGPVVLRPIAVQGNDLSSLHNALTQVLSNTLHYQSALAVQNDLAT